MRGGAAWLGDRVAVRPPEPEEAVQQRAPAAVRACCRAARCEAAGAGGATGAARTPHAGARAGPPPRRSSASRHRPHPPEEISLPRRRSLEEARDRVERQRSPKLSEAKGGDPGCSAEPRPVAVRRLRPVRFGMRSPEETSPAGEEIRDGDVHSWNSAELLAYVRGCRVPAQGFRGGQPPLRAPATPPSPASSPPSPHQTPQQRTAECHRPSRTAGTSPVPTT